MSETMKVYEAEEIKIVWKPGLCTHAAECVKGLSSVFNTQNRPWVSPENASDKEIMQVIDRCPSKALSYESK